ncbi:DUF2993 domain-containing protein [Salinibacterium sp. ZJ77]|uniref:LmeA family phospholipid-binding protein n=1 Tax=Salinibacterium sp. ZJ77 TaxID=2708337 RepID=UPI00142172F0|nr:DUF2993 domain-containing protein [Salinibacterium sp. ZJ77]
MMDRDPSLSPAPRSRRIWPWVVAVFLIVLVSAVIALIETVGRGIAVSAVEQEVRTALDVPAETPVGVDLGPGSLAFQALTGRIEQVNVTVDPLALGPLSGEVLIEARGVPLDQNAPVRDLQVSYRVPEEALGGIADRLSGVDITSVSLEDAEIVASGEVSLLGMTLPLGLGLTPGAADGVLTFTPTSIRIGDSTFDAATLASDRFWGDAARTITQTRAVCIADRLPAALTLEDVRVDGGELVVELNGAGQALGGSEFRTKGVCPE